MDIVILTQAEAQSRDHVGGGGRLLVAGQCHRAPHWSPLLLLRYLQHFILGHLVTSHPRARGQSGIQQDVTVIVANITYLK